MKRVGQLRGFWNLTWAPKSPKYSLLAYVRPLTWFHGDYCIPPEEKSGYLLDTWL